MSNELTLDEVSNIVIVSIDDVVRFSGGIVKHVFHLQFPALKSKHVYIRDKIAVLETINAIRQDGMNNLQVLLFTSLIRTSL